MSPLPFFTLSHKMFSMSIFKGVFFLFFKSLIINAVQIKWFENIEEQNKKANLLQVRLYSLHQLRLIMEIH